MNILREAFRSAFGIVAVSWSGSAWAAESLPDASTCAFASANVLLVGATLAGAAAGCAILATLFRQKAHWHAKQLMRQ